MVQGHDYQVESGVQTPALRMSISNIRLVFPAACETWAYSCVGNVNRRAVGCLGKQIV